MVSEVLLAILVPLFGPNPPIVVSKQTTVITSPLRGDGLPDYQKYWRDAGRAGVTHENNAAVLFWQAVWPGELKGDDRQLVSQALGFEDDPETSGSLQAPYCREVRDALMRWLVELQQRGPADEHVPPITSRENLNFWAANQFAEDVVNVALTRPWTSQEIPPLADWVAKNAEPFRLLIEATTRPKWWSPGPALLKDRETGTISVPGPAMSSARDVVRALSVRAMWHAGEGRPREAWNDLQACLRLARFLGEGPSLISQLVAMAMDGIALDRTIMLLQQGDIDAALGRQILRELMEMDNCCDVASSFDAGERIALVEMTIALAEDSSLLESFDSGTKPFGIGNFAGLPIDWNVTLRDGNRWYDRLVAAANRSAWVDRHTALAELDQEASQLGSTIKNPVLYLAGFASTAARSSLVADVIISHMLPASSAARNAEDRAATTLDLTRVAAALAVYRAEQGEYPERLPELVPGVIAKVPEDLYARKPFSYRRMPDGGYLLYSVFENGQDDGGSDRSGDIVQGEWVEAGDVDYANSDLVIRVPIPIAELPELPELSE